MAKKAKTVAVEKLRLSYFNNLGDLIKEINQNNLHLIPHISYPTGIVVCCTKMHKNENEMKKYVCSF